MALLDVGEVTAPGDDLLNVAERLFRMVHIEPAANAHGVERVLREELGALRGTDVAHRDRNTRRLELLRAGKQLLILRLADLGVAGPREMRERAGDMDPLLRRLELPDQRGELLARLHADAVHTGLQLDLHVQRLALRLADLRKLRHHAEARDGHGQVAFDRRRILERQRAAHDQDVLTDALTAQCHALGDVGDGKAADLRKGAERPCDADHSHAVGVVLDDGDELRPRRERAQDRAHVFAQLVGINDQA